MFHAKYFIYSSLGFSQEYFYNFTIYIKGKSMTPGTGPILTLGLSFEQTWKTAFQTCFIAKI
jgi:hypothetical protein